ncbi:hypothetical protein [Massilia oculi]|uniref:hypothetical protein n=1 Tax=Massilia oculi TaxID=945844 RepID=UPI001AAF6D51|nr:hypothetical protein [Massilia oculi]
MIETDEKTTTLLVKLNKLTSLNKINWTVEKPPHSIAKGTDDHIPLYISAFYKDKVFGIFQQRYQSYDGDHERFYWSERVVLAILDHEDNLLWEVDGNYSALYDLFETVRRKVARVDDIIGDLINDDDDEL